MELVSKEVYKWNLRKLHSLKKRNCLEAKIQSIVVERGEKRGKGSKLHLYYGSNLPFFILLVQKYPRHCLNDLNIPLLHKGCQRSKKSNDWNGRVRVEKRIPYFFLSFKTVHETFISHVS